MDNNKFDYFHREDRAPWPVMALVWGGVLLATLAFWGMVAYGIYYAVTLPIVYESYETGQCVRVDDVRGEYTCENMPRKFHHEWTR